MSLAPRSRLFEVSCALPTTHIKRKQRYPNVCISSLRFIELLPTRDVGTRQKMRRIVSLEISNSIEMAKMWLLSKHESARRKYLSTSIMRTTGSSYNYRGPRLESIGIFAQPVSNCFVISDMLLNRDITFLSNTHPTGSVIRRESNQITVPYTTTKRNG